MEERSGKNGTCSGERRDKKRKVVKFGTEEDTSMILSFYSPNLCFNSTTKTKNTRVMTA
jgi:hypothetical protein